VRGFDNPQVSSNPRPYYTCAAKTIESMQPCLLREDKDIRKYGVKVLVKDASNVKAWEPTQTLLIRLDRDEQIDGSELVETAV
jgi:hypothetical protein